MGRETKNFRQTARSRSGNDGARNFASIQRNEPWHKKIMNYIKIRGKGERGV